MLAVLAMPGRGYSVGPAMSCDLGCLVNARRSLYQSKPSIEDSKANTARSGCKAQEPGPAEAVCRSRHAAGTARQSRQPDPTQVSGLIAAQLRAWSHEIAANRWYGQPVEDPTGDDQRRSRLIRHVARRRSRITRKTASFGRIIATSLERSYGHQRRTLRVVLHDRAMSVQDAGSEMPSESSASEQDEPPTTEVAVGALLVDGGLGCSRPCAGARLDRSSSPEPETGRSVAGGLMVGAGGESSCRRQDRGRSCDPPSRVVDSSLNR